MWRVAPWTADSRFSARISASNRVRMGSASRVIRESSRGSRQAGVPCGIYLRQPVCDALDRGFGRIVEGSQVVAIDVDLGPDGIARANQDHQLGAGVAAACQVVRGLTHVRDIDVP